MVQHVLGSTVPLVLALETAGVKREHLEIVGKAYSSSRIALRFLAAHGFSVRVAIRGYGRQASYEDSLRQELSEVLATITGSMDKDQRLLILDEGGNAINLLHREFANFLPQTVCVEQTARGASSLVGVDLRCPVVNVARSWAKSELEAPIIARGMLQALDQSLTHWTGVFALKNRDVLVLGFGSVGQHVCREFVQHGFNVSVLEQNHQKKEKATAAGYCAMHELSESDLDMIGIIAGCTGGAPVGNEVAQHAGDQALLVSMASSDLEFQPWKLQHAEVVHQRLLDSDDPVNPTGYSVPFPWRTLYRVRTYKGHFYLANGGFPINFTGALDPIPALDIQLTRALMLIGAFQATETRGFGLAEMDPDVQRWLAARFKELQVASDS
jgi:S-adenosylhomocysteine hydrolase